MRFLLLTTWLTLACIIIGNCQDAEKHTVYFDLGDAKLNPESTNELNSWFETLPDSILKIEITGYADFVGSSKDNLDLSKLRAENIVEKIELQNHFKYKMVLFDFDGEKHSTPTNSISGNPIDRKVEISAYHYPRKKQEAEKANSNEELLLNTSQAGQLSETKVGETLVLENLNFIPGQHFLQPQAYPELEVLVDVLKKNPNLEIEIQGHICCQLTERDGYDVHTKSYDLSANRAKYIYDQLTSKGIDSNRLNFKGFSGTRPLVFPEKTELDRAKNRRVEIKVLKK